MTKNLLDARAAGRTDVLYRLMGVLAESHDGKRIPYPTNSRERAEYLRGVADYLKEVAGEAWVEATEICARCDQGEEEW